MNIEVKRNSGPDDNQVFERWRFWYQGKSWRVGYDRHTCNGPMQPLVLVATTNLVLAVENNLLMLEHAPRPIPEDVVAEFRAKLQEWASAPIAEP